MIDYPDDRRILDQARTHGISPPVLIRDLVRVVEVLNLRQKEFFNPRSVLAGSMALRSYGSPRFTVYDADFSTSEETVRPPTTMKKLLAYEDDDLAITPAALVPHDEGGSVWKSAPIDFVPVFTALAPAAERSFKADVSFRGLVLEGREEPLRVPYDLGIWSENPIVFIMDPHEMVAEKICGWCANEQVKHYVDLAFIGLVSEPGPGRRLDLNRDKLREVTAEKLEIMRELQPGKYGRFESLDDLIRTLEAKPHFDQNQWENMIYVKAQRERFTPIFVEKAVRETMVPKLK